MNILKNARRIFSSTLTGGSESVLGYKVYTALLDQIGTNAPTATTVLANTLGETPTFQYNGPGDYAIVTSGKFTFNKTAVFIGPNGNNSCNIQYFAGSVTGDYISLFTFTPLWVMADDLLSGSSPTTIEIRVYP